jgi:ribonuclease P protein component
LKLHREFQYIYRKGKSQHSSSVVLFFFPQEDSLKVGFTATKKVGNAVKRNRSKRRLRALFLDYSNSLKNGTYIFVAKQSTPDVTFEELQKDFLKVLKRSKTLEEK